MVDQSRKIGITAALWPQIFLGKKQNCVHFVKR